MSFWECLQWFLIGDFVRIKYYSCSYQMKAGFVFQMLNFPIRMIWSALTSFLKIKIVCVCAQLCPTLRSLWTVAHWVPLSMNFSRQEYWSRLHFLLQRSSCPRDWTESPASSVLAGRFFTTEPPGKPKIKIEVSVFLDMSITVLWWTFAGVRDHL